MAIFVTHTFEQSLSPSSKDIYSHTHTYTESYRLYLQRRRLSVSWIILHISVSAYVSVRNAKDWLSSVKHWPTDKSLQRGGKMSTCKNGKVRSAWFLILVLCLSSYFWYNAEMLKNLKFGISFAYSVKWVKSKSSSWHPPQKAFGEINCILAGF